MSGTRTIILVGLILAVLLSLAITGSTQTIEGLQTPPTDTAEAQRLRIWAAAEGTARCRMVIEILNDSNQIIRNLVNFLAPPGYYNFYWDKRDDSGARVPEGRYRARTNHCGKIGWETLTAQYTKWEILSDLGPYDTAAPFDISLILTGDSIPISVELLRGPAQVIDTMLSDTLLNAGTHRITYVPVPNKIWRGNYVIRVMVGDYEYRREVTYLP